MGEPSPSAHPQAKAQITEDEASLYDRQIRLWGLEAQNRMRSSTVLVLSLRSLAHETIKNLVLAGIGRLIVADSDVVTSEDLGAGFLFREENGAVGKPRTEAALPQIASLNPLVTLDARSIEPFVGGDEVEMAEVLKKEGVDVVVACDLARKDIEVINDAARKAGALFYAAGTYGFDGYVFSDLGETYDYVQTVKPTDENPSGLVKKSLSFAPFSSAFNTADWGVPISETKTGSPFRGVPRNATRALAPQVPLRILALWEFEKRHGFLPTGQDGQLQELTTIIEELRVSLGVNPKYRYAINEPMNAHLAAHATHFFPPTLAVLGGFLAQDVLRTLSKKDMPIVNLLAVDTAAGDGVASQWGVNEPVDV
ncbi:hypothetical protein IAT38_006553 [Cryptococcus sp. DSM 104549]